MQEKSMSILRSVTEPILASKP